MTENPSIYEKTFAKTDETDAILVVDGEKLHVNKMLLSIHSDYFKTLFNSDFKEKSMKEIPINDVTFEDFATVLSLIHPNPIDPTARLSNITIKNELADRFLLPAAKRHLEILFITSDRTVYDKVIIADRFNLQSLMDHALKLFKTKSQISFIGFSDKLSDQTKAKIFDRLYALRNSR